MIMGSKIIILPMVFLRHSQSNDYHCALFTVWMTVPLEKYALKLKEHNTFYMGDWRELQRFYN